MYACEYDIDGNDERDSDISVDELSKLDWIDWEKAVEGAEIKELKKFTLMNLRKEPSMKIVKLLIDE